MRVSFTIVQSSIVWSFESHGIRNVWKSNRFRSLIITPVQCQSSGMRLSNLSFGSPTIITVTYPLDTWMIMQAFIHASLSDNIALNTEPCLLEWIGCWSQGRLLLSIQEKKNGVFIIKTTSRRRRQVIPRNGIVIF